MRPTPYQQKKTAKYQFLPLAGLNLPRDPRPAPCLVPPAPDIVPTNLPAAQIPRRRSLMKPVVPGISSPQRLCPAPSQRCACRRRRSPLAPSAKFDLPVAFNGFLGAVSPAKRARGARRAVRGGRARTFVCIGATAPPQPAGFRATCPGVRPCGGVLRDFCGAVVFDDPIEGEVATYDLLEPGTWVFFFAKS